MSELLTQKENECLELLDYAWNKYLELPSLHPTDRQEFMQAIHCAQNILFARIYLRSAQHSVHADEGNRTAKNDGSKNEPDTV